MSVSCCDSACTAQTSVSPRYRKALWIALIINAAVFAVEIVGGFFAEYFTPRLCQQQVVDLFGKALRQKLLDENSMLAKSYLNMLVEEIVVETATIKGSYDSLAEILKKWAT